jgi:RNA polymerase sigma-70 factor (ECF subfamily)
VGTDEEHDLVDLVALARSRLWRAFVAARGVDGADEAVAEALAWAWEHRSRLLAMDNPVGYLYRVGLSRSTVRRRPELPAPADVSLPHIEPGLVPALLALPETQRSAVWLVHACGWTYAEVAEALEIGRSTVGTHVSRAMSALRKNLEVSLNG